MQQFLKTITACALLSVVTLGFAQQPINNGANNVNAQTNHNAVMNKDDSAITAKIKTKIGMDKLLSDSTVNVSTHNGIVVITGNVDSDSHASQIVEMAQSVTGVRDVDASGLAVKESNQPLEDTYITAKVKGMFIQEKLFGDKDISAMGIRVETNNGIVYLTGTADNQKQAQNAVSIAKAIHGVKKVESSIQVNNNGN